MIFEKPSLRTRVTFEVGIGSLGGTAVYLDHTVTHLGARETVRDVAKNLARWVHGIVARVFKQAHSRARQEREHPGDQRAFGRITLARHLRTFSRWKNALANLRGLKLAYVGDGNNMCHSLLLTARVGAHIRVATPAGYEPDAEIVAEAKRMARETRGKIEILRSPEEAVAGCKLSTRTCGPAWGRRRKRRSAKRICRLSGERALIFAGRAGCCLHALLARASRT